MKESNDILKDIFSNKLTDYKPEPDPEQWLALQKDLKRKRFFRFGWGYFNIYYVLLLTGVIILVAYSISNKRQEFPQKQTSAVKFSVQDTSTRSDSTLSIIPEKENINGEEAGHPKKAAMESSQKEVIENTTSDPVSTDTASKEKTGMPLTKSTALPDTLKEKPKEEQLKPKTTFIPKKDTIIRIDTIKVRKRKKK